MPPDSLNSAFLWHFAVPIAIGMVEMAGYALLYISHDIGKFWPYAPRQLKIRAILPLVTALPILIAIVTVLHFAYPWLPKLTPIPNVDPIVSNVVLTVFAMIFIVIPTYLVGDSYWQKYSKIHFPRQGKTSSGRSESQYSRLDILGVETRS